jgi:hypothetical protein
MIRYATLVESTGKSQKAERESVKKTETQPQQDAPQVKAVQVPKAKVCIS